MAKKILVLCGSSRKGGNTDILAQAFIKGAKSSGNEVEKLNLCQMSIQPCIDCKYCYTHEGKCVLKDDMEEVYEKLRETELLVLAAPVYFYNFPSRLKAVIDRLHNPIRETFRIKETCLLTAYADQGAAVCEPMVKTYEAIAAYLNWRNIGIIYADGVEEKGSIVGREELKAAEQLGKTIH